MKLIAAIALGVVFLSFQSAQADLLFSDNFDSYATGGAGTGDGTWSGANSGLNIASGSLTYGSLYTDSSGTMLSIANGAAGTMVNTYANQTSGQIYYSFLFDPTVVDSGNTYFTALNPGTGAPNGGSDVVDAYYYSNGRIGVRGNPASTVTYGTALTLNTTYFIVERIDLDAHTANLWLNPDSSTFGTLTPPTATLSLSSLTTGEAVDDVGFKAQSGTGSFYVDDLLIGTTWADVTSLAPIPEPSTFALAGLGMLGLAFVRRMRR